MAYNPNLDDPRIQRRSRRALGMTIGCLSEDKSRQLGTRFIDQHFGQGQTNLSKWLRKKLLVPTSETYKIRKDGSGAICKEYKLNQTGVEYLANIVGKDITTHTNKITVVDEWIQHTYEDQLSGEFEYTEKSYRLWNPIQGIRRDIRHPLLARHGFCYSYDIDTAAPTILYQLHLQRSGGIVLDHIDYYISNKDVVRSTLAELTGLEKDIIKKIINALFAGAILARNNFCQLYHLIGYNKAIMKLLQSNRFIIDLKEDIRELWTSIKQEEPIIYKRDSQGDFIYNKSGSKKAMPFRSKRKWHVYFREERRVLDVINQYLKQKDHKFLLEHDGFTSNKEISITDLSDYITYQTGYCLSFSGYITKHIE